jgi:DNA mismatch repair protein MutL
MSTTRQIRLLSDSVINKIAAGEVVERPASVLKELMENALDAGATAVDVTLVGGGCRAVVVQDNGSGMERDDALLCIERHATSKIRDAADIEEIGTLGFRGEALAAIASVSRFTLVTRTHQQAVGTEVVVHGGTVQSVAEAGAPPGTCVAVRNLFFNVPARRKFLRTEQTEFAHARQMFLVHALAHPAVGMTLTAEDREIHRLAGGATLEDRLRELFGAELLGELVRVAYRDVDVRVAGYAGRSSRNHPDRSEQYLFVNGRPASAPVLGHAIREAYQASLPRGRHPVLFLFLETDPGQVDVNVHPTKKEVRFRRPREVRDGLAAALTQALHGPPPSSHPTSGAPADGDPTDPSPATPVEPLVTIQNLPLLKPFAFPRGDSVLHARTPASGTPAPAPEPSAAGDAGSGSSPDAGEDPWEAESPWAWCRILGQVGGLYVVMETDQGLVLMDPQAAHERVLFEAFRREIRDGGVRSQGLVVPETVEVSPRAGLHIRRHLETLTAMGFGISEFGGDHFLVDALPACLGGASAVSVLSPVAEALEAGSPRRGADAMVEEQVAREACRAAVSGRRHLQVQEMERLVQDLARTEMPYTCPHGRPTLIFMGFRELDRKFGRRG